MSNANNILLFFIFQGHDIRVVIHDGEPWFVAKDVCDVLEIGNASLAINGNPSRNETGLDEDEKGIYLVNTPGGPQATLCINEPGLYRLIAKSHKPEAKNFQRWVYHEVLPAIRKTGRYSLPQQEPAEPHQQPASEVSLQAYMLALSKDKLEHELQYLRTMVATVEAAYNYKYPHLALSKDALRCELHYLRTLLATVETIYNYKYSLPHNSEYPQEEQKPPYPVETIVLPPVDTKPDLQTILLDYLHKTGTSVTVRHLQQSGPRQLRNLPADHLRAVLQALVANGVLTVDQVGKSEQYRLLM